MHFSRLKFRSSWSRRSARMTNGWTCDWYWVARVTLSLNQPGRGKRDAHTLFDTSSTYVSTRLNALERPRWHCLPFVFIEKPNHRGFLSTFHSNRLLYIGLFSMNKMVNNRPIFFLSEPKTRALARYRYQYWEISVRPMETRSEEPRCIRRIRRLRDVTVCSLWEARVAAASTQITRLSSSNEIIFPLLIDSRRWLTTKRSYLAINSTNSRQRKLP